MAVHGRPARSEGAVVSPLAPRCSRRRASLRRRGMTEHLAARPGSRWSPSVSYPLTCAFAAARRRRPRPAGEPPRCSSRVVTTGWPKAKPESVSTKDSGSGKTGWAVAEDQPENQRLVGGTSPSASRVIGSSSPSCGRRRRAAGRPERPGRPIPAPAGCGLVAGVRRGGTAGAAGQDECTVDHAPAGGEDRPARSARSSGVRSSAPSCQADLSEEVDTLASLTPASGPSSRNWIVATTGVPVLVRSLELAVGELRAVHPDLGRGFPFSVCHLDRAHRAGHCVVVGQQIDGGAVLHPPVVARSEQVVGVDVLRAGDRDLGEGFARRPGRCRAGPADRSTWPATVAGRSAVPIVVSTSYASVLCHLQTLSPRPAAGPRSGW